MRIRAAFLSCLVCVVAAMLVASPASAFRAQVRHAEVRGGQIAWYERGSGPPLVMLIGTGSTMAEWDPALLDLLARDRRLVMLDYPGLGESGPWRGPCTFAGLSDEVARSAPSTSRKSTAAPTPRSPTSSACSTRPVAAQIPGARLRLLAGAHAFLFQQRFAFAKVVDHFLAD